ncbi:hypothetical protein GCM10012275_63300 [Longimycelium tulufanense]|uniref:Secreted protein n=1 Tax=Longimycelium tulufanense TaxID=907463 RepID=A0A8J3CIX6_9PSEU|nr:hypothetical protein [Longimycelium tulufanense]GGM84013.1 hypothetical protein GCM10012275_63300 [Longimycelium tulufanense]
MFRRSITLLLALVAAVTWTTVGVGAAQAAQAPAHLTATCGPVPPQEMCVLETPHFPGGTIAVDVDVIDPGKGGFEAKWYLSGANGQFKHCVVTFKVDDPAQSWLCHGLNPGWTHLYVSKNPWMTASIGLRW